MTSKGEGTYIGTPGKLVLSSVSRRNQYENDRINAVDNRILFSQASIVSISFLSKVYKLWGRSGD